MVTLGPVALAQSRPVSLGSRPAYRMGQASLLSVRVLRDGVAAAGVPVEVMLMNRTEELVTGSEGMVEVGYGPENYGMATIRISPPSGVRDMGEGTVQTVELNGAPSTEVVFKMMSLEEELSRSKNAVVALATSALLVLVGTQA